jgi:outer membrane protein assembly factor BamA
LDGLLQKNKKYSFQVTVIMGNHRYPCRLIRLFCHILLGLALTGAAAAQDYTLQIHAVDDVRSKTLRGKTLVITDSLDAYRELKDLLLDLRREGYLAASLDSLVMDGKDASAWVFVGPRFEWGTLSLDSLDRKLLRKAGIRERDFAGKPVRSKKLASAQEKILQAYENNGYPFASLHISQPRLDGPMLSGNLRVAENGLFRIDTIHIKGEARISPAYLEKLTAVQTGDVYREDRIRNIPNRIRETTFLEEIRPFELEYFAGKVDVYTYLKKARANQFNGIVGILPNNEQTGRLLVTGDLHLSLVNPFGQGEQFYVAWRSLQPLSQELELNISWPYLFGSSVGIGVDFSLLKQDTAYFSVNPVLDLRFFLGGTSYFHAFFDYFNSSLISTWGLENAVVLPPYADVSSSLYGLGIHLTNLDYTFNPRKGWEIHSRLGIGSRKIRRNAALPEEVYETVRTLSTQLKGTADIRFFQPLGGRFTLHLAGRAGYIGNDDLFANELFRLGGIRTLRGVDEHSIFASFYSLGTLETRFLFERNSSVFLFLDGGYYEQSMPEEFISDYPLGFGAGINMQTRAGIFSLNYALGKAFNNPINIGNAKIHIGYINRF